MSVFKTFKAAPFPVRATVSLYALWQLVRLFVQHHFFRQTATRQRYHIADVRAPRVLLTELIDLGFQPNYFALVDQGELSNLRRLIYFAGKLYQEHVRIFPDELRGHLEIAYDYGLGDAIEHVKGTTIQELSDNTILELRNCLASLPPLPVEDD